MAGKKKGKAKAKPSAKPAGGPPSADVGPCVPATPAAPASTVREHCYAADAAYGCHIVGGEGRRWWGAFEELPPGIDPADVPEIAVDPGCGQLSAVNAREAPQSYTISVEGAAARGLVGAAPRSGVLPHGSWRDAEGETHDCITFIAVVPPLTILDLAVLPVDDDLDLDLGALISSDIQNVAPHPRPDAPPLPGHRGLAFPLEGPGPFVCTQERGGGFTHHFAGNFHAVDFRCAVGEPVVACADGVVLDVSDANTVSGIHVSNLFKWNSVLVGLADGTAAEYVHLRTGSAVVKKGDAVVRGQKLAEAGDVGFCPEPHLHFQLLSSGENDACSLPFTFAAAGAAEGEEFVPVCGRAYGPSGEASG